MSKEWLLSLLAVISIPALFFGQGVVVDQWLERELRARGLDFLSVIDIQRWPQAPVANTFVVVGMGKRTADAPSPP